MLDADLFANAIVFIKNNITVTTMSLSNELCVNKSKAKEILEQLEECKLIVHFDGFWACVDWAELN